MAFASKRAWWFVGGGLGLLVLAGITIAAVLGSSIFAIQYVREGGPISNAPRVGEPGAGSSPGP